MHRIIMPLMLMAGALFPLERSLAQSGHPAAGWGADSLTDQTASLYGLPHSELFVTRRPAYGDRGHSTDSRSHGGPLRSHASAGDRTGRFIGGMMANVSEVAFRIQHFMRDYASYDSEPTRTPRRLCASSPRSVSEAPRSRCNCDCDGESAGEPVTITRPSGLPSRFTTQHRYCEVFMMKEMRCRQSRLGLLFVAATLAFAVWVIVRITNRGGASAGDTD